MNISVACFSMAGPRSVNEDYVAYWNLSNGSIVCAIADGLGGMGGGDKASRTAVSILWELIDSRSDKEDLRSAARSAHLKIVSMQQDSPDLRSMATTLTAILLKGEKLVGVHCGDTRAVIIRGKGILRLTTEHTEGQRLFAAGKLSKYELLNYSRRNILESALGAPGEPRIDTFNFKLEQGDRIFLTSDGVHEKVLLREFHPIVVGHDQIEQCVAEVKREVERRGPTDNFSAVGIIVQ